MKTSKSSQNGKQKSPKSRKQNSNHNNMSKPLKLTKVVLYQNGQKFQTAPLE